MKQRGAYIYISLLLAFLSHGLLLLEVLPLGDIVVVLHVAGFLLVEGLLVYLQIWLRRMIVRMVVVLDLPVIVIVVVVAFLVVFVLLVVVAAVAVAPVVVAFMAVIVIVSVMVPRVQDFHHNQVEDQGRDRSNQHYRRVDHWGVYIPFNRLP